MRNIKQKAYFVTYIKRAVKQTAGICFCFADRNDEWRILWRKRRKNGLSFVFIS